MCIRDRHKKQSGGHGQYGHVKMEFAPYAEGDYLFQEKIFGGSVPKNFHPAVDKGIREAMEHGVLAGYPMVGPVSYTHLDVYKRQELRMENVAILARVPSALRQAILARVPSALRQAILARSAIP